MFVKQAGSYKLYHNDTILPPMCKTISLRRERAKIGVGLTCLINKSLRESYPLRLRESLGH
jgi:hypothetical protein